MSGHHHHHRSWLTSAVWHRLLLALTLLAALWALVMWALGAAS